MSQQITTAMVEQYNSNFIVLSQQKGSRYRGTVRMETLVGKSHFFERIGSVDMVDSNTRHDDTPQIDTPHSRRKVSPITSRYSDLVDKADIRRVLIDPQSAYTTVGMYAAGRRMDQHILAAATGLAYAGETGATTVALPTAQKVAAASSGLTLAKLIAAREILEEGDVDLDMGLTIAVRPDGLSDLLAEEELTSADYNTVRTLVAGQIDTFMGFKFIMSNLVPSGKAIVWQKNAIGIAVSAEPYVRISERADKNYSWQVFVEMDMGATRVEEAGVVEISYV
jgi:hypothetical protein